MSFLDCHFEQVKTVPKGYVHLGKTAQKPRAFVGLILGLLFGHHLKHVHRLKGEGGFGGVFILPSEIMDKIKNPPRGVSDEIRFWMG